MFESQDKSSVLVSQKPCGLAYLAEVDANVKAFSFVIGSKFLNRDYDCRVVTPDGEENLPIHPNFLQVRKNVATILCANGISYTGHIHRSRAKISLASIADQGVLISVVTRDQLVNRLMDRNPVVRRTSSMLQKWRERFSGMVETVDKGDLAHEIVFLSRFQKNMISEEEKLSSDDKKLKEKYDGFSGEQLLAVINEKRKTLYSLE